MRYSTIDDVLDTYKVNETIRANLSWGETRALKEIRRAEHEHNYEYPPPPRPN